MSDEIDIQKLLRLKRFEQPDPEYFDNFLEEFQRRQREEFLKRSLWQIISDRTNAFMGQFAISQFAYGAASAAVLIIAGVMSMNILSNETGSPQITAETTGAPGRVQSAAGAALIHSPAYLGDDLDYSIENGAGLQASVSNGQPRYVIDARPVSYEAPFSF